MLHFTISVKGDSTVIPPPKGGDVALNVHLTVRTYRACIASVYDTLELDASQHILFKCRTTKNNEVTVSVVTCNVIHTLLCMKQKRQKEIGFKFVQNLCFKNDNIQFNT